MVDIGGFISKQKQSFRDFRFKQLDAQAQKANAKAVMIEESNLKRNESLMAKQRLKDARKERIRPVREKFQSAASGIKTLQSGLKKINTNNVSGGRKTPKRKNKSPLANNVFR